MKLNVGCGNDIKEGYVNIDALSRKADMNISVTEIGKFFNPNTVDEIYCSHMLEHLDKKPADALLKTFNTLLRTGGTLFVAVPCLNYIIQDHHDGVISDEALVNTLYGLQRDPYDHHKYGYTTRTLQDVLEKNGFKVVKAERGRPNYGPSSPGIMVWAEKK